MYMGLFCILMGWLEYVHVFYLLDNLAPLRFLAGAVDSEQLLANEVKRLCWTNKCLSYVGLQVPIDMIHVNGNQLLYFDKDIVYDDALSTSDVRLFSKNGILMVIRWFGFLKLRAARSMVKHQLLQLRHMLFFRLQKGVISWQLLHGIFAYLFCLNLW